MKIEKVSLNRINKESTAYMEVYVQEASEELYITKRPLIIQFPGGGYWFVSDREDFPVALSLSSWGYNVAVVHYSVAPATYPSQYIESFEALDYLIKHSEEYFIDTDKISVIGFSAGGHAAAMMATGCKDPFILKTFNVGEDYFKIQAMVLSYPVITGGEFAHRDSFNCLLGMEDSKDSQKAKEFSIENRVNKDTPKAFIWSTFEDELVPCENSLILANKLRSFGIPFELHIFEGGQHGLSLSSEITMTKDRSCINKECEEWLVLLKNWLYKNVPIS